jgi:hypothetical protein
MIPPAHDPYPLLDADFRKKNTKAKTNICYVVRDHVASLQIVGGI